VPILKDRANIYMAGHEHTMQHIAPEAGVHFIVNGPRARDPPGQIGSPARFTRVPFTALRCWEAGPGGLKLSFVDTAGKTPYEA
jgi:hypothetical protein